MGDKPRASILTNRQREYLLEGHDPANPYNFRDRIRDRVHMSVLDYHIILRHMALDDIRAAFQAPAHELEDEPIESWDDLTPAVLLKFGTALPSVFGVPYIKLFEVEQHAGTQPLGWLMESYIEAGIKRALNRMGERYDHVTVTIDIDIGDPFVELASRELSDLDRETLDQLRRAGRISTDQFARAWVESTDN